MPNSQQKCWQASGRPVEDKIKSHRVITWFWVDLSQPGHREGDNDTCLLPTPILSPYLFIFKCFYESSCMYGVAQTTCVQEKILKCKRKKKIKKIYKLNNSASSYNVQKSKRLNKVGFFPHLISCTSEAFVKRSEILLFIEFLIWSLLKGSTHVWFSLSLSLSPFFNMHGYKNQRPRMSHGCLIWELL